MKKLLAVFVSILGCALSASADNAPVVTMDIARVKAFALDAIKAKHPDIDLSTIQYMGTTVSASTNDAVVVNTTYLLANSGTTTNEVENHGFIMNTTKQTTLIVKMDELGHVTDVSKGSSLSVRSVGHMTPAHKRSNAIVTNMPNR